MKKIILLVLAAPLLLCGPSDSRNPANSNVKFAVETVGAITDERAAEVSGIALSRTFDDVLWAINDSGDDAAVYALNLMGELNRRVLIDGAENLDWEDLAWFRRGDKSFLLIADTGNNVVFRDVFTLYVVEEPLLDAERAPVMQVIRFRYEDGPHDCEAVAVDALRDKILLLTKREVPALVYELPLSPVEEVAVARQVIDLASIPQPTADEVKTHLDRFHAQPTGMDMLPDGSRLAVLTYRRLFIFMLDPAKPLAEAWLPEITKIEYPALEQAEAVCFGAGGETVLITTEKLPAPLLQIKIMQ